MVLNQNAAKNTRTRVSLFPCLLYETQQDLAFDKVSRQVRKIVLNFRHESEDLQYMYEICSASGDFI